MEQFDKKPEDFGNEVEALEAGIKDAQDFDELFEVLKKVEVIEGSQETVTAEQIMETLQSTRTAIKEAGSISPNATDNFPVLGYITKAHGLREKVKELLVQERDLKKKELEG